MSQKYPFLNIPISYSTAPLDFSSRHPASTIRELVCLSNTQNQSGWRKDGFLDKETRDVGDF